MLFSRSGHVTICGRMHILWLFIVGLVTAQNVPPNVNQAAAPPANQGMPERLQLTNVLRSAPQQGNQATEHVDGSSKLVYNADCQSGMPIFFI